LAIWSIGHADLTGFWNWRSASVYVLCECLCASICQARCSLFQFISIPGARHLFRYV